MQYNIPGQLTLITGLPGSGKSRWMEAHTPPTLYFVVDDFMAHSFGDIPKFTYSRWYLPLVFAVRSGRNGAISDIAFCDAGRRTEAERVMRDAVDSLACEWIYFENEPEACRRNIERRAREEGRELDETLEALEKWRREYQIPPNSTVIPVYRGPVTDA